MTDKEAKRSALINGKVLKDDNSSLADRLIDYSKDGDLWTSAFFGALGGAGFGAAGVQNNYKNQQKFDKVLQAHHQHLHETTFQPELYLCMLHHVPDQT